MHRATSLLAVLATTLLACGTTVSGGGSGGGGDAGGPPADATTGTAGGGAPGPGPLDCEAHVRCAGASLGDEGRSCSPGTDCMFVPGCVTAVCVDADAACASTCVDSACMILESYPAQIACDGEVTEAVDDVTCDEVMAEVETIRSCTAAEECGLVLEGTSCGCTRDLVARLDAPVAIFEALWAAAPDCGFGSTCDCPEADGFACVDGLCTWSYVDGP